MRPWRVRDVMTREVLTVHADAPPAEAINRLTGHDISALAVVDDFDNVLGVLTRTDVLDAMALPGEPPHRRWRRRPASFGWRHPAVRQMMSSPAATIGPDDTVAQAGRRMSRRRVNRLLVIDHRQHLLGIVTAADLLRVHTRSDDSVRSEVQAALPPASHDAIGVSVHDGVVTLSGEVTGVATARLVRDLAQSVPGVADVVTDLQTPAPQPAAAPDPQPAQRQDMDAWWLTRRRSANRSERRPARVG